MVSALNKNNTIEVCSSPVVFDEKHWACKTKGLIGLSLHKRKKNMDLLLFTTSSKMNNRENDISSRPQCFIHCHWEQFLLCHWKHYSPRMLNTGSNVEHRTLLGLTPPVRFPCTNWPSPVLSCPPPFNKYTQGTRTKWMKWMQLIRKHFKIRRVKNTFVITACLTK